MNEKRVIAFILVVYCFTVFFLYKTYIIQIKGHNDFSNKAFLQQTLRVCGLDFTNATSPQKEIYREREKEYMYLIKKSKEEKDNLTIGNIRVDFMRFGVKIRQMGEDQDYIIVISEIYDPKATSFLVEKYDAYVLEKSKGYYTSPYNLYVYTDARGKILRGMPTIIK